MTDFRPAALRVSTTPDPARLDPDQRLLVAERLAALGRSDLAVLYVHCDRFYPEHDIAGSELPLTPTPSGFGRSLCGSSAAACAEG